METGMTIAQMLEQSAVLTVLGMCVVFAFLVILIGCMNVLRIVVHAAKLDKVEAKVDTPAAAAPAVDQKAIVAAIATALHEKN
ncbi:OadG family protein [Treponema zioleckii]|uniref:OadG family protein n=1 Tax=Treponema zioleckii TaxID=331680 RepID=UPI001F5B65F0|nr:OadG family protein [Treponema zioleckii]